MGSVLLDAGGHRRSAAPLGRDHARLPPRMEGEATRLGRPGLSPPRSGELQGAVGRPGRALPSHRHGHQCDVAPCVREQQ